MALHRVAEASPSCLGTCRVRNHMEVRHARRSGGLGTTSGGCQTKQQRFPISAELETLMCWVQPPPPAKALFQSKGDRDERVPRGLPVCTAHGMASWG